MDFSEQRSSYICDCGWFSAGWERYQVVVYGEVRRCDCGTCGYCQAWDATEYEFVK